MSVETWPIIETSVGLEVARLVAHWMVAVFAPVYHYQSIKKGWHRSKLDLLIRVQYSNPVPAPPCPPKLLEISTNPMRYAQPEFLNAIAEDTLPMIVDVELGMCYNTRTQRYA